MLSTYALVPHISPDVPTIRCVISSRFRDPRLFEATLKIPARVACHFPGSLTSETVEPML
jgi:hypothetical protein